MGTTASRIRWSPGACDPRGRQTGRGARRAGTQLRAASPVARVCPCVAPRYEPSGPAARHAHAVGGALGVHWASRSSCDGGARRPGPRRVLEERVTLLSWVKASVY